MVLIVLAVPPKNVPDSLPSAKTPNNRPPPINASISAYSVVVAADSLVQNRLIKFIRNLREFRGINGGGQKLFPANAVERKDVAGGVPNPDRWRI